MNRLVTLVLLLLIAPKASFAQSVKPMPDEPAHQLKTLSQLARQFLTRQQADSAWQQAIEPGLPLLKQVVDTSLISRQFRYEMLTCLNRQKQFQGVIRESPVQIRLCRQTGDLDREGQARRVLSMAYLNLSMYEACIKESLQIIPLFTTPVNHDMLARTYTILGDAYMIRGYKAQGKHYARLGIEHGKLIDKPESRAIAYMNEGILLLDEGKKAEAIRSFQTILPVIEKDPSLHFYLSSAYSNLANAYYLSDQYNQALLVLDKALRHDPSNAGYYSLRSKIYDIIHQPQTALREITTAFALLKQGGSPLARQDILSSMSIAQERAGLYKESLRTARQLAKFTDSLNAINRAETIATAETRFNVKAKNETIGLLNQTITLRQQQAKQEQQTALIIIVLLTVGFGIVGFFWYRARQISRVLQRQKTEIETQARQLVEINGIKDQLFSIVSHDLRGPVMSLQQGLDRLETATQTALPDALPRFRQSVDAVASLTDNVLCWSLAQMNGLRTSLQPFALAEVVSYVLALYAPAINQKKLAVVVSPDLPEAAHVLADENQAEIALRNIIQNAIKFSPVGGQLTLGVEQETDLVRLLVTDEGPGFDGQLSEGLQTKTSTGLGLKVVRDLMSRNGGAVGFQPRTDRSGTVVRLSWPVFNSG